MLRSFLASRHPSRRRGPCRVPGSDRPGRSLAERLMPVAVQLQVEAEGGGCWQVGRQGEVRRAEEAAGKEACEWPGASSVSVRPAGVTSETEGRYYLRVALAAASCTPPTGDVPATKVHALDRDRTQDPSVRRPTLYPRSHTG
ncbi:hypothetical protein QTO34_012353 [Cnephaeus nilssonii]|uniref:Uncharacterized protein n=1 Tax=Cnephaeus nilssonii TaxID=3371016 RepID=A0AA40LDB8_CNENI|nr:hypothetical protein QTO34_012353 [Eptesicus nilssonii]